jgi:hypothetical protein
LPETRPALTISGGAVDENFPAAGTAQYAKTSSTVRAPRSAVMSE